MIEINNLSITELENLKRQIENKVNSLTLPYNYQEICNHVYDKFLDDKEFNNVQDDDIDAALTSLEEKGYILNPFSNEVFLNENNFKKAHTIIIAILQNRTQEHPLRQLNAISLDYVPLAYRKESEYHFDDGGYGITPTSKKLNERLEALELFIYRSICTRFIELFIRN